jgi:hypothetical protein
MVSSRDSHGQYRSCCPARPGGIGPVSASGWESKMLRLYRGIRNFQRSGYPWAAWLMSSAGFSALFKGEKPSLISLTAIFDQVSTHGPDYYHIDGAHVSARECLLKELEHALPCKWNAYKIHYKPRPDHQPQNRVQGTNRATSDNRTTRVSSLKVPASPSTRM